MNKGQKAPYRYKQFLRVTEILGEYTRIEGYGRLFRYFGFDEKIELLPEREREVIKMRFGIDGKGAKSLEEVGREFGVTRERIREIEARGLNQLSKLLGKE
jgi:DNA-directed RNA polymerase sigma subunit (sigma70/sigma32)